MPLIDHNGQLEAAVAVLINNQAHFLAVASRIETEPSAIKSRIETELSEIKNILIHHEHILNGLPEAIREKIGFSPRK